MSVYLDNNATTFMHQSTIKEMMKWVNVGNPSSSNKAAQKAKKLLEDTKLIIRKISGLDYEVIFTSGASEANSFILQSVVKSCWKHRGIKPHIITSTVEHKSILLCCQDLVEHDVAEITYVNVTKSGHLNMQEYVNSFRNNTVLVCIMHANNETGAINNIKLIGKIAEQHKVPFYSDTTQSFGKYPIIPKTVGAFCLSAHKFNGPSGIGAIVIHPKFVKNYFLKPIIFGTQNDGLRGGTENIIGIAGMRHALTRMIQKREEKNKYMCMLKSYLLKKLSQVCAIYKYEDYTPLKNPAIVIFSDTSDNYLCNTLLLSYVKYSEPYYCNAEIKKKLEKYGFIVSIGSACNTNSKHASHVIDALGVDNIIRKGVIRISFHELVTKKNIDNLVDCMYSLL